MNHIRYCFFWNFMVMVAYVCSFVIRSLLLSSASIKRPTACPLLMFPPFN